MIIEFAKYEPQHQNGPPRPIKVGDTVINIGVTGNQLIKYRKYKILELFKEDILGGMWFCYVQDLVTMRKLKNNHVLNDFVTELEIYTNKYNI